MRSRAVTGGMDEGFISAGPGQTPHCNKWHEYSKRRSRRSRSGSSGSSGRARSPSTSTRPLRTDTQDDSQRRAASSPHSSRWDTTAAAEQSVSKVGEIRSFCSTCSTTATTAGPTTRPRASESWAPCLGAAPPRGSRSASAGALPSTRSQPLPKQVFSLHSYLPPSHSLPPQPLLLSLPSFPRRTPAGRSNPFPYVRARA